MCQEREILSWTFQTRSWGSVLISIYQTDAHDRKTKVKVCVWESDAKKKKNAGIVGMNLA